MTTKQGSQDKPSLWLILVVIALVVIILSVLLVLAHQGFDRFVDVNYKAEVAKESFQKGAISLAARQYIQAVGMSLEGQIRWSIAMIPYKKAKSLQEEEQYEAALDKYVRAVRILGTYDNEGTMGYECSVMDIQLFFHDSDENPFEQPFEP
ncbi:MAG: hypothetical protein JXJ17_09920 [Anaerolineae bacterium]|nr:hypothetical protein [Anaerolineae bacterium]